MILVVEARVIIKWLFRDPAMEEHAEPALRVPQSVRARTVEILQPPHWIAELAAMAAMLTDSALRSKADAFWKHFLR